MFTLSRQIQRIMMTRFTKSSGAWLLVVISVVLLVSLIALAQIDARAVLDEIRRLSAISLFAAATFLIGGVLLAALRLWFISKDIGTPLTFKEALLALSVGQIVGAVSVQFFGQIAARSALLGRRGVSAPANIVMAAYERLVSVAVSALMAATGAWFLFGRLALDIEGGGAQLLRIVAGIVAATTISAAAAWGAPVLQAILRAANAKNAVAIGRNLFLTIAIQLTTAAAYVIIAGALLETTPLVSLIAATVVIMFAASLPISFSGWGVRELSAVLALGAVGVKAPTAIAISVVIGAMALGAVIIIAGIATVLTAARGDAARSATEAEDDNVAGVLKWTLPLAAATAVFFQIYIPAGATRLNVNLADPIVILGAALFILGYGVRGTAQWRFKWLNISVVVATCALALSYVHGYMAFGWSSWAFTNRLVGWLMLLCYGMTGALIAQYAGERGAAMFARTFIASAVAIVLFELTLVLIACFGVEFPTGVLTLPLEGFSQNRNAFSFALLLAICAMPLIARHYRTGPLAILLLGLWFAGSRAALGTVLLLFVVMLYMRAISVRALAAAALGSCAGVLFIAAVPSAALLLAKIGVLSHVAEFQFTSGLPIFADTSILGSSNVERFTSMVDGLRLFQSHPIFGAGLGFYISEQVKLGTPLVIHSTPIWLLAEGGVVTFAAFAVPFAIVFVSDWKRVHADVAAQAVILMLAAFAVMSSVHELLYQRALWLLLGLCLSRLVTFEPGSQIEPALNVTSKESRHGALRSP